METSLSISNEKMTAVSGRAVKNRVLLTRFASVPLPAGAVINGVITDEKALGEGLKALSKAMGGKLGNVKLVLGSSQIYTKRGMVPKLPRKKVLELVAGEFSDLDAGDDEMIYDYAVLGDMGADKGNAALLCAAKKSLVGAYAELFAAGKMRLTGLTMTHDALCKLVRLLPQTREDSFVLLDFDGNTLDALLFVEGEFRFSNRIRLIADKGTPESTGEILRVVSSLIQFNTAQRSGHAVETVYLLGAGEREPLLSAGIQTTLDLTARELTDESGVIKAGDGFRLDAFAFAVGNLL
jgi:Tfp pilus assembly PilM family ATPase